MQRHIGIPRPDYEPSAGVNPPPEPPPDYDSNTQQFMMEHATKQPFMMDSTSRSGVTLPDYNSPVIPRRSRSIGVAVLPPLNSAALNRPRGKVGAGHNKAWLHHVKNHRKFDTLNSFRSVDDCPICQAMDDDEVMLTMRHRERSNAVRNNQQRSMDIRNDNFYRPPAASVQQPQHGTIAEEYEDDSPVLIQQQRPQPPVARRMCARARRSRPATNVDELSVADGELVQVLDMRRYWWQCFNSAKQVGWVPADNLYLVEST